jgi:excisionase family DNA binding protein
MDEEFLSVDQVAGILGLQPRTVRSFIKERRLKARKLGKEWRIRRQDLDALTGSGTVHAASSDDGKQDWIQVSAVVDLRVSDREQADRICNLMLAAVTGKGPEYGAVNYGSLYLENERKARLMFWGDAAFIGNALLSLQRIPRMTGPEEGGKE